MKTEIFRVHGRVQGVGFRYFVQQQAHALGITGFVRNEPDGSVLTHAQSESTEKMQEFERLLNKGPAWSRVTKVDHLTKEDNSYDDFRITF